MDSNRSDGSSKERLKWTSELHTLFEKSVNQLGGLCTQLSGATPKGILKAMGIPGLTIFHVKSHLQKYRMSKFIPESPQRGTRFERRSISELLPNFSATSGAQLNEALQMQKEVQRRLRDQNEVQKNLKMKIEAQGRFLDKIGEEYRSRAGNARPNKPYSPAVSVSVSVSLPSLCEESDSEIDKSEIRSLTEFRAPKRLRIDEEILLSHKSKTGIPPNSESYINESMFMFKGLNSPCWAQEVGFPWNATSHSSPMLSTLYDTLN